MDFNAKSQELLSKIANSLYDRNPDTMKVILFNGIEIQLVEEWLKEFSNHLIIYACGTQEEHE